MVEVLTRRVSRLILVQSSHTKAASVEVIQRSLPSQGVACQIICTGNGSPREALIGSYHEASQIRDKVVLLVCGSFYVVSSIRAYQASISSHEWAKDDPVFSPDFAPN